MAIRWIFGACALVLITAAAGMAVADGIASSKAGAFYAPGRHQFYVWCAHAPDFTEVSTGKSAEDAQMTLYRSLKARGRSACWPVWQSKLPG
jgi:hypothetical protein